MDGNTRHLIMVGVCYLDTILDVPFFPSEDSKLRATNLDVRRGGNCPNSLQVLQQLVTVQDRINLNLVSCLPSRDSLASRRVEASFGEGSPVNLRYCVYHEDHSEAASSYVIRSAGTGTRTLVSYNDLPEMTASDFERIARAFDAADETWWHFEGRIPDKTLECIRLLRRILPNARASVEVEKPKREGLLDLAAEADVVFFSRSWAESRGHTSAEACLKGEQLPRASLALCTWGSEGAASLSQYQKSMTRYRVAGDERGIVVVDAVGAGDTFIAGMLYGLLCHDRDWDTEMKLRFAAELATLKVQREGFNGLGADAVKPHPGS